MHAEAQDPALRIQGQFTVGHMVAAVGVGEESVGAVADPFHGPAQFPGRPHNECVFRKGRAFHAEAAADIGGDDAKLIEADAEHANQGPPHAVHALAADM